VSPAQAACSGDAAAAAAAAAAADQYPFFRLHLLCHLCSDCVTATLEGPGIIKSECPVCHKPGWKNDLRFNHTLNNTVEHARGLAAQLALRPSNAGGSGSGGGGRPQQQRQRTRSQSIAGAAGRDALAQSCSRGAGNDTAGRRGRRGRNLPDREPEHWGAGMVSDAEQQAPLAPQQEQAAPNQQHPPAAAAAGAPFKYAAPAGQPPQAVAGAVPSAAAAVDEDGRVAAQGAAPITPASEEYDSDWEARVGAAASAAILLRVLLPAAAGLLLQWSCCC
jgi:hypothetical protein